MNTRLAIIRSEGKEHLCYREEECFVDVSYPMVTFTKGEDDFEIVKCDHPSMEETFLYQESRLSIVIEMYHNGWPALSLKDPRHDKLIIAGKLGPEPDILIHMYQELITRKTNIAVELKPNFGKTAFLYEALKAGSIDLYPEFTGTITSSLLKEPPPLGHDARSVYEAARDKIKIQDNLAYLEPMSYQNTYAVAVPRSYAEANGLTSISDLHKVENRAIAGFTLEFNDREDGNRGLASLYGLHLQVRTMEPALRYQAISQGIIQITDAYSTDSELKQYGLVLLKDDKQLFPPYQGAPLMRQETLDAHPELKEILEQLSGRITEEEMSAMNYDVRVNKRKARDVAIEYLKNNGLI